MFPLFPVEKQRPPGGSNRAVVTAFACWTILLIFLRPAAAEIDCSKGALCIETRADEDGVHFYASNKKRHKISVHVTVTMRNMTPNIVLPAVFVVEGDSRKKLFVLTTGTEAWHFDYRYHWVPGDIHARHDNSYRYRLPFPAGRRFRVTQSCSGAPSHNGKSKYAIDFDMPVGTPVHAAREGLVVDLKNDSDQGGNSKTYEDDTNYVLIEHADGTIGEYYHLRENGASVHVGQFVQRGALIGYSGNTGYSAGPHLHFVVGTTTDGITSLSVPATFATREGPVTCPPVNTFLAAD